MITANQLRDQTSQELEALSIDKRKELFELVNKNAREKNTSGSQQVRGLRKDIARILTVLRQKELAK